MPEVGKTQESLDESREIRAYLISKYGFIPESIIAANWSIRTDRRGQKTYLEHKKKSKHWNTPFTLGDLTRGQLHSDFPHNISRFLIKFLTEEKLETPGYFSNYFPTVLDPFVGHNSRMEDCFATHRNYVGWDICKEFMEANWEIRKNLLQAKLELGIKPCIELLKADSRDINYDSVFDMALTSPPYWDIEFYGDELEQLGKQDTFTDFMYSLGNIFKNIFKALKPNTFFVVETNDFRRGGVFYTYHEAAIQKLRYAGFTIHDIIICDYKKSIQQAHAFEVERTKIVGKRHSYFIICQKQFRYNNMEESRGQMLQEAREYEKEPVAEEQQRLPMLV